VLAANGLLANGLLLAADAKEVPMVLAGCWGCWLFFDL
jgi:hypothetical protein